MSVGWADRWRQALGDGGPAAARRLQQGRAYQRAGRVTDVRASAGRLSGRVQGTRATPYLVEIDLAVWDDGRWARTVATMAAQVGHGARLLAGLPPEGLEEELHAAGIGLLPQPDELRVSCACDEPGRPCTHGAAVWEAAARQLGGDPFLPFRLRGRGRERLLADLAAARRQTVSSEGGRGLDPDTLPTEGWTRLRSDLSRLSLPAPTPPRVPAAPLRLLGDPPGWAGSMGAWELFRGLVERGAAWARRR